MLTPYFYISKKIGARRELFEPGEKTERPILKARRASLTFWLGFARLEAFNVVTVELTEQASRVGLSGNAILPRGR